MSNIPSIGFLGFGEAARAFHATLAARLPEASFAAYDIKLDGDDAAAMRAAMEAAAVTVLASADRLAGVRWLFSAVTADQSLKALEPVLPSLAEGTTVIDINSVSPGRKVETARRVAETGARYIDMAVMAPVHPRGHATPVLVAGSAEDHCFFDQAGFDWDRAGDAPGAATAIKMIRSVFVKGLEAITAEALLAAERTGCRERIEASLAGSFPGLGWPGFAEYVFDRTLIHGTRRAAEMHECAATLAELGLAAPLASAIAEVQARQGAAGSACLDAQDLDATIARTLDARLKQGAAPGPG